MLNFTIKNLFVRKSKLALICIAILIASTVGLIAINVSNQVHDGIINTAGYYDTIVGPQGSSTQLALSTMFFSDKPLGTLEYEYYNNLKNDNRINVAIPMAMGDSYKSHKIIGTIKEFIEDKKLEKGELFKEEFEAVIGKNVAKNNNLKVGDTFISSHGISEQDQGHAHENVPYTVVGILGKTGTAYDNNIFVEIGSIWHAHSHEEEHNHSHDVTAILIRTKSMRRPNGYIRRI